MEASIMNQGSSILIVLAALVFGVNIIVEVVKNCFTRIPTTLLATAVSLGVTLTAFLVWAAHTEFPVAWYHIAGVLMLGMFVAYAAMFGFDKFKQVLEKLKNAS